MRGVRGQITLIVIIGIVILFVIGLFYLMAVSRAKNTAANEQAGAMMDEATAALVSNTVASCLDAVVNDEITILGETGALPQEDGYPSGIVSIGTKERRMLYGVTRNRNDSADHTNVTILPYAYSVPRYPDHDVRVEQSDQYYDDNLERLVTFAPFQDGYFGDVNFPAICDTNGPNGPRSPFRCRSYPGNPPGTAGPSMQEQLGKRIAQRVSVCANPKMLSDTIGQTVTGVSAPTVNLTFTPNNVLVTLRYALDIQGRGTTALVTTPRVYRVRLMPLLQFAVALAREDSRNVTFDPARDYKNLASWKEGFTVLRGTAAVSSLQSPPLIPPLREQASLITVIDSTSLVDGVSYQFSFLVEHRPPMLTAMTGPERKAVLAAIHGEGDTHQGGTVAGVIVAADPDDGPVTLSIIKDAHEVRLVVTDEDGDTDWDSYTSNPEVCTALGTC